MSDVDTVDTEESQFLLKRRQLMEALNEIDEKLDSLSDSESAGKRAVSNQLVEQTKSVWSGTTEKMVEQFKQLNPEQLAGTYLGITRTLRDAFDKDVQEFIAKRVETQPKSEPQVSEDEAKELASVRPEVYKQIKSITELIYSFGEAPEGTLPEPRVRRGSSGKRGKRQLSYYSWSIDGEEVAEDDNSPAGVAKLLGFEKAADFTKALKEAKVNTTKPDPEFTVEINGKSVNAVRDADAPAPSEDEENGESEASEAE